MRVLKWILWLLAGLLVIAAIAVAWYWASLHPDPPSVQVWRNGQVITMDSEGTVASALAIEGDRIVAVGTDEDVAPWLSDAELSIDLEGRAVVPGFIEAHGHFPGAGLDAVAADLSSPPVGEVTRVAQAIDALRAVDAARPGSGWLVGFGYDDTLLTEKRHLSRADLDRASTSRPVLAIHVSGHIVAVNSVALERFEIGAGTPNPPGGEIEKDPLTGEPSGVLFETAGRPLMLEALQLPPLDQLAVLGSAVATYARQGFTTVQNGLATEEQLVGLNAASRVGIIPFRIVAWPDDALVLETIESGGTLDGYRAERMHVGAVKLVGDGSIQGYTGYLRAPYHVLGDHPEGYRGYPNIDAETMNARVKTIHCAGYPLAVHGNGDAAIDQFLDAWEAALAACPSKNARPILVHAQMASSDQLERMRTLGVSPTFFSAHVYYWGDRHRDIFLGPERAASISPAASAQRLGLRFTTHLDTPVVPIDSALQLWAPVARETSGGAILGAEERIDAKRSLRAMTIDAAWQLGLDDQLGSIEPGKAADLVILSADPLDPSTDLRSLQVERTVVAGVSIYETTPLQDGAASF